MLVRGFLLSTLAHASVAASLSDLAVNYLVRPIGVDAAPHFSYRLNLGSTAARGLGQASYQIIVTDALSGRSVWDSGKVASNVTSNIRCTAKLASDTRYTWTVDSWLSDDSNVPRASSTFHTGLLDSTDWKAHWITGGTRMNGTAAANLLRKSFSLDMTDASKPATLFVAGIGYSEVLINGQAVTTAKLEPGWTDHSKRVVYTSYDVSGLLALGANVLGVALGNGWWSCGPPPGSSQPACDKASPPQLILQLQLGGTPTVLSDLTWVASPGPITYDSLYNGETFDGRKARSLEGWATSDFDASSWSHVLMASSKANAAVLSAALFEPVRHLAHFTPLRITSPRHGVQVFDFMQNIAGIVQLSGLRCSAGTNVTLRHAELLQHPPYGPTDGSIYVGNLRSARATDVYTCSGDASGERYTPTFTQHGFRYVEVSGLAFPLRADQVTAVEMHTDIQPHSTVLFSQPLLNQIQHNTVWGQKANVMSGVATDCPQRDERRGWTGDAALTAEEAVYNFMMGAVYTRWLLQYQDDQTSSGASNNFVPDLGSGAGAPNWQSAYPSIVWALYRYYGDVGPAETHHASLIKYYDNLERQYNASGGLLNYPTGFGDWVPAGQMGDHHLIGAFALLHDLKMGADFWAGSSVPGAAAQAARCTSLFARGAKDFHKAWYKPDKGYYANGMQTEQAMALYLDIVPADLKAAVLNYTIHDVMVTHRKHTTTGIIGIKCLLEVLAANGRADVALEMLLQDTYPSYGYMIKGGELGVEPATTLWELWNSDQEGPGMNSRNHIMFGTVSAFFYRQLMGITPLKPGYAVVGVQPTGIFSGKLTHASASVWTPRGDVHVSWQIKQADATSKVEETTSEMAESAKGPDSVFQLQVTIPSGATALVAVAASAAAIITEGGQVVWQKGAFVAGVPGFTSATTLGGPEPAVQFAVASGTYVFEATM